MNKKAQGLSINVIIIVAISLIVLVVLVAVFTGNLGKFSGSVSDTTGDIDKNCADIGEFVDTDKCGSPLTSKDSVFGKVCCKKSSVAATP